MPESYKRSITLSLHGIVNRLSDWLVPHMCGLVACTCVYTHPYEQSYRNRLQTAATCRLMPTTGSPLLCRSHHRNCGRNTRHKHSQHPTTHIRILHGTRASRLWQRSKHNCLKRGAPTLQVAHPHLTTNLWSGRPHKQNEQCCLWRQPSILVLCTHHSRK